MSIFTREGILKEIENKAVVITSFSRDQAESASVDLHLGGEFRMFKKVHQSFVVDDVAVQRERAYGIDDKKLDKLTLKCDIVSVLR